MCAIRLPRICFSYELLHRDENLLYSGWAPALVRAGPVWYARTGKRRTGNSEICLKMTEQARGLTAVILQRYHWFPVKCLDFLLRRISYGAGRNPSIETSRPLATSTLAVGRFAAKKGSLRWSRSRLVASL